MYKSLTASLLALGAGWLLCGCDSACCQRVLHPPVAKILGLPSDGVLAGSTLGVQGNSSTDSDGNVVSYLWKIDGNPVSQEPNPTLTFDSEGKHEVCLTVTDNDGKSDTTCKTVTVPAPQGPTAVITGADSATWKTDCPIRLSATHSYTGDCEITHFAWTKDADTTPFDTANVVDVSFPTTGNHRVCLTASCDNGLSDTKCESITVHPHVAPTPILTAHFHSDSSDLHNHSDDNTTLVVKLGGGNSLGTNYSFIKGKYYDFNCSLSYDDCNQSVQSCSWHAQSYHSDNTPYISDCFTHDSSTGHNGALSDGNRTATTIICGGAAYFDINLTVTDRFGNTQTLSKRFYTVAP